MTKDGPRAAKSSKTEFKSVEEEFGSDVVREGYWHFSLGVIDPDEPVKAMRSLDFEGGSVLFTVKIDQHEPFGKFMLVDQAFDTLIYMMRGNPM